VLVQRNADAARYAERLRQDIDGLAQQKITVPARPGPKPPLQSRPTQLPPQSAPTPRLSRPLPVPSAAQGLQTARQSLAAGGVDPSAPPGAAGLVRAWSGYLETPESGDLRSRP
jgi:hypothetical protein